MDDVPDFLLYDDFQHLADFPLKQEYDAAHPKEYAEWEGYFDDGEDDSTEDDEG